MLLCKDYDNSVRWIHGERLNHLFEKECDRLVSSGLIEHPAVITDTITLTYQELDQRANQVARYLLQQGLQSGDRVGLLFDRSIYTYIGLLAVLKIDAAYVPFDAAFPIDRIGFIAQDSEVKAIVTLSQFEEKLGNLVYPIISLDSNEGAISCLENKRLSNSEKGTGSGDTLDQLSYIIYTSGSTGNPKGVAVEHASICNFVRVAGEVYGIKQGDRVYQGMTIAFDFSVEEIWIALTVGATLVPGQSDANLLGEELADFLAEKKVTALCCVPTLLATINRDLPDLRFILVSGEACPYDLVVRWHRPGRTMLNAYGPTEATVTATWTELHPDKPVTIGGPLPTYVIVILDAQGKHLLDKGEMGEVCIAGIGLAKEYVNRKDLTEKSFISDFLSIDNNPSNRIYRTGDLGRINDNNEIEYHGRIDTQVKIRGYRIELTEIESVILQMPGIAAAVVNTYSPEPDRKELVAYYTLKEDIKDISKADLFVFLKNRLPGYMVPAFLEQLDEIPMLPSNKADRKRLPKPKGNRFFATNDNFVAPKTEFEIAISDALSEVLKLDKVSVDDDFFNDLGAHSLLMAQFTVKIKEKLPGTAVSMRDIYLNPSVTKLASVIETRSRDEVIKKNSRDFHIATNFQHLLCGSLQFLHYTVASLLYFAIGITAVFWILGANNTYDVYLRSTAYGIGAFILLAGFPILLKWLLVGKWTEQKIPIWSLSYFRFWLVRQLIETNPFVLFKGTPIYNVYLRLLGAKVGSNVVLQTAASPVCPDLFSIGDNSILRADSFAATYKAESGYIITSPVTIGKNAFVGEASMLDIGARMEDNTQLGHASLVHENQTIPAGKNYHGSPAQETTSNYNRVKPLRVSGVRKIIFCTFLLVSIFLVGIPSLAVIIYQLLPEIFVKGINLDYVAKNIPDLSLRIASLIAIVTSVIFLFFTLTSLIVVALIPRLLSLIVRPDRVYPMFGVHYYLYQILSGVSNSPYFNNLFGDASFIVYYKRWVGYNLSKIFQTGSNFGSDTRHDYPSLCQVGSKTLISDGLSMVNTQMSNSSFQIGKVTIGEKNFLGNKIKYPFDSKTGDNVLLATKVMIPIEGSVRENVGLLGSPSFEIPRSVVSHQIFDPFADTLEKKESLRKKNWFNFRTMCLLMMTHWLFGFLSILFSYGILLLYSLIGIWSIVLSALVYPIFTVLYFILAEKITLKFRELKPYACTIHDEYFWFIERNWKIGKNVLRVVFKGTPFRPIVMRLLGSKVGKQVFDDGSYISEESLTTIGDYCCLNNIAVLQPHSLEDGMFKSDYIRIGRKVTLGLNCHVHYGTSIKDNAILDTDSFLMKGTEMKAKSVWRGNPAQEL